MALQIFHVFHDFSGAFLSTRGAPISPSHCASPWEFTAAKALNHSLRCCGELAASCRIHRPGFLSCGEKNGQPIRHQCQSLASGHLVWKKLTFLLETSFNSMTEWDNHGKNGWCFIARPFSERVIYSWRPISRHFGCFPQWIGWVGQNHRKPCSFSHSNLSLVESKKCDRPVIFLGQD